MFKNIILIALVLTYSTRVQSLDVSWAKTETLATLGLSVAYNPANDKLIAGTTDGVFLYTNLSTGANENLTFGTDVEKIGAVKGVTFIDNGNKVAAVIHSSETGNRLRVWDAGTFALLGTTEGTSYNFGDNHKPEEVICMNPASTDLLVAV